MLASLPSGAAINVRAGEVDEGDASIELPRHMPGVIAVAVSYPRKFIGNLPASAAHMYPVGETISWAVNGIHFLIRISPCIETCTPV
jgi:hypothetical protein